MKQENILNKRKNCFENGISLKKFTLRKKKDISSI